MFIWLVNNNKEPDFNSRDMPEVTFTGGEGVDGKR